MIGSKKTEAVKSGFRKYIEMGELDVYGFLFVFFLFVFFFKQKTAYEIRNCDWSSDVCSSDLRGSQKLIGEVKY